MSEQNTPDIAITDAELVLMRLLWRENPLTAREITQRLEQENSWHRKTVNTLLSRLEKKGALGTLDETGAKRFIPLVAQDDFMQSATSKFVDRMFGGNLAPLVASFAGRRPLDADQLEELRDLLKDLSDDD